MEDYFIEPTAEYKLNYVENFKKCPADIENIRHHADTEVSRLVIRMGDRESKAHKLENKEEFDNEFFMKAAGEQHMSISAIKPNSKSNKDLVS